MSWTTRTKYSTTVNHSGNGSKCHRDINRHILPEGVWEHLLKDTEAPLNKLKIILILYGIVMPIIQWDLDNSYRINLTRIVKLLWLMLIGLGSILIVWRRQPSYKLLKITNIKVSYQQTLPQDMRFQLNLPILIISCQLLNLKGRQCQASKTRWICTWTEKIKVANLPSRANQLIAIINVPRDNQNHQQTAISLKGCSLRYLDRQLGFTWCPIFQSSNKLRGFRKWKK